MNNSRIVQVLKTLSIKEIRKLYDFIDSPFFNCNKDVCRFFSYIKPYLSKLDHPAWDKTLVFSGVFGDIPYNNLKINYLISDCLATIERFLCHMHLNMQDTHTFVPIFDFYQQRNLPKHYEALHRTLESLIEKMPYRDDRYLYQKWVLETRLAQSHSLNYIREDAQIGNQRTEIFDQLYLLEKLKYLCIAYSQKQVIQQTISVDFEEAVVKYIEQGCFAEKNKVIYLYFTLYKMLKNTENTDSYFVEIEKILPTYASLIHPVELQNIYIFLQNDCIQRIKKSSIHDKRKNEFQLFSLYKQQLARGFNYDNQGNIQPGVFKNIVLIGLRLQEVQWVREFMEAHTERLPIALRQDVLLYCQGLCYFEEKNYSETIKILHVLSPVDIFFNINARRLLIKSYYEEGDIESVLSQLNAFRVFIHREDMIQKTHKESNRNFANILAKLSVVGNKAKLEKIQAELEATTNIAENAWLKEKIALQLSNDASS